MWMAVAWLLDMDLWWVGVWATCVCVRGSSSKVGGGGGLTAIKDPLENLWGKISNFF